MKIPHVVATLLLSLSLVLPAQAQGPQDGQSFKTPQEAVKAMGAAAASKQDAQMLKVFGASLKELLDEDPAARAETYRILALLVKEKFDLAPTKDKSQLVRLGMEGWPFPIPLIKDGKGWRFDLDQGAEELINRRIGRNELLNIETCQQIAQAQEEYRKADSQGAYAGKIGSTPGKKDGLFWPANPGEPISPLQKSLGDSFRFVKDRVQGSPWFGYHYRPLLGQGPAAKGGAFAYIVDGRQTKGWAFVAYPANYGKSGVKSFIVNQDGKIFEKDLGPKTIQQVFSMELFDPGEGWVEVAPAP